MKKFIDARGVECPKPVILTKEAFEDINMTSVEIKVDNMVAFENVKRYVDKCGGKIEEILKDKDDITIIISRDGGVMPSEESDVVSETAGDGVCYVITSREIGRGDALLGKKLMDAFISTLSDYKTAPKAILFMNYGVFLCLDDSEALESIKVLHEKGTEIIVCGTCTNYLDVTERVSVGILGNMYDLVEIYNSHSKVISL